MKKIFIVLFLFMLSGMISYGQFTASLSNRTASPNDTVKVNLNVTGFSNIASITFYIQIDPNVLTFQGISNFSQSGMMASVTGNTINIVWTNPTAVSFPNGTLLRLNFKYNGLSSPVVFLPNICEVVKLVGNIPTVLSGTYTDGSVHPFMGNVAKARLDSLSNIPLGLVTDTLRYTGFQANVGAITQRISYDPSKLTFISVTGAGTLAAGLTHSVASGIITLTWSSATPKNINYPGNYFKLNFQYTTAAATNVSFSTGCIIETVAPVTNIPVTYYSGRVAPPPVVTSYATIGTVAGAIQGQLVDVPVSFASMPAGTNNFNLNINFDSPRLSFIGLLNPVQPVNFNVNGNLISITNSNPLTPSPSINGQFLTLRFQYNGIGTANVNFGNGCQFSAGTNQIGVGFTNGSVVPGVVPGGYNANIAYVNRSGSGSVSVPVTFSAMPSNIGAITMNIGFDNSKLSYTGVINPNNATVKLNGNTINLVWTGTTPFPLDTVVKLQFNYIPGAGNNCAAAIYFTDGCQVASLVPAIIPTNWNNGGVNVKFKISGTLEYNSDPSPQIALVGHTVKLVTLLGDSVTSAVSTATGFEMWAPAGSYELIITPAPGYQVYSDLDDAMSIFDHFLGYPIALSDQFPIRLAAGDLDEDGEPDLDDAMFVFDLFLGYDKSEFWTAPDWIYHAPPVDCNCIDVTGITILGLNSGNVLGTNSNP
jgi:hypothetical protein